MTRTTGGEPHVHHRPAHRRPSCHHHPVEHRDPDGSAGVQRRVSDRRDRREAARPPRLPARCGGVHELDPGGLDLRPAGGIPRGRDHGRGRGDLLRADGLPVAVPDRERRHRLLLRVLRPLRRAPGAGDPRRHPGHRRRHVVPLGHRLRASRRRPRPGRQLPAGRSRLRRPAARGWPVRPALPHQPRDDARSRIHQPEPRATTPPRPRTGSRTSSRSTPTHRAGSAPASAPT